MSTYKRSYNGIKVPKGRKIRYSKSGKVTTPNRPVIPFIEGDGIGPEIFAATRLIVDEAVKLAYMGAREIAWYEILAGGKAQTQVGNYIPDDTLAAIKHYGIAIKGPLNTPTGGGFRSINVKLRQTFDLYQCVRPVRYFTGVPSVVVAPQNLDVVIFRENTEDVYAGIEFQSGSADAKSVRELLSKLGHPVREDSGIGIKPISEFASKRLVRAAIEYAIAHGKKSVTLVHKGNIQKFTEGAFREWGYQVARTEFADVCLTWDDLVAKHGGKLPEGKVLINDRIADAMFFEVLTRPQDFSVIATTNLNGDYLSDACAAQVGGLGIAPGANIGKACAIFEATHGTAPTIAGQDIANPGSLLLSAVMMLEFLGWNEAAEMIVWAFEKTIQKKTVTGDLSRFMSDATTLKTSEFAKAVVANFPLLP